MANGLILSNKYRICIMNMYRIGFKVLLGKRVKHETDYQMADIIAGFIFNQRGLVKYIG
jgi:hypothetical protein